MSDIMTIEKLLIVREDGWWEQLCDLIPEIRPLSATPQPVEYHSEGDVAVHTRLAIEACPKESHPDLLWVALLHDIGKPETTAMNENGRITAYGHAKRGAEMAEMILKRLGFPDERIHKIVWVIRYHGFYHSWQIHNHEDLSNRQRRFLSEPNFPLLLEFIRIDSLASHGKHNHLETYSLFKSIYEDHLAKQV